MAQPRGSLTYYRNLFDEETAGILADEQPTQQDRKKECLIDFYYYTGRKPIYTNNQPVKISYSSLLEIVGNTFFLSTFTVHNIIKANSDAVALVKQQWKDQPLEKMQKEFARKWPQLVW